MAGMRGWTKILMWTGILLVCAGVGAFVASRSNLFPPAVGEGGPGTSPAPSEPLDTTTWRLIVTSRSSHAYRVGGACTSDWLMRARIRVSSTGRLRGAGTARLRPGAACDFPSAQVQAGLVQLRILGRREGGTLRLRFREKGVEPVGSQDLGGFVRLLPRLRVSLEERGGAEATIADGFADPDGDVYEAVTVVRLTR